GNNAAGTRLRKGLQEIKKKSQAMRNEITATKAEHKG
ncbi:MAG: histone H1, partial [Thermodesulfobacteriota bacterium]